MNETTSRTAHHLYWVRTLSVLDIMYTPVVLVRAVFELVAENRRSTPPPPIPFPPPPCSPHLYQAELTKTRPLAPLPLHRPSKTSLPEERAERAHADHRLAAECSVTFDKPSPKGELEELSPAATP